jgi:hypothetical protein
MNKIVEKLYLIQILIFNINKYKDKFYLYNNKKI